MSEYSGGLSSRDYIAEGGGELIATENASGLCITCYFGTDHLGSVRIVMDQNGGVVARHDYLPFGEELRGAAGRTTPGFGAADLTTQRFTGQMRDSESGQDFFNARYFMAPLGRFNSADPMNAGASLLSSQSWNGYAYVLGNPLGPTDPSGARWRPVSTQGCTAVVSSSMDYSATDDSFVNNPGTTFECHYTTDWVWVPDPVDTVGSGGSGGGGGGPAKTRTVNLQDAKARCVNGLILGGITTGFSDFLGIGPDPDPTGDFTQPARDALKNPVVRVAAAVTVSNVVRRVATRQVALRAAAVGEDVIPVAGQLVLAYQVGHAVYSGLDYHISGIYSGACENPHE